MKIEQTESKKVIPQKKKKRRSHKLRNFVIAVFLIGFVVVMLFQFVLFPAKTVTVTGSNIYTADQILTVSGIGKGTKLFSFISKNVSDKISKKLPYVEKVDVVRKIPSTIILKITDDIEKFAFYNNGAYVVTDAKFKTLDKKTDVSETAIKIKGLKILKSNLGDKITFENNDAYEIFEDLYKKTDDLEIKLSEIDVSDITNIKTVVANSITVELGTQNDLSYKILHLKSMLKEIGEKSGGSINLKNWTSSSQKGYYSKS